MEHEAPSVGREPWRIGAWLALAAIVVSAAYAGRFLVDDPIDDPLYRYDTALNGLVVYGILLGLLLLVARGVPRRRFFALERPAAWGSALGLALAAYVAIFLGAGLLLWALDATGEQGLTPEEWNPDRLWPYLANAVVVAGAAPLVEELFYRGAGFTLFARWGPVVAVLVTAVVFGLGHGLVLALPAIVWFGVVTALLRIRTGSVYPGILVHCAFNATSLIVSVAV